MLSPLVYCVCVEKLGCNILFITDSYLKEIVPTVDVIGLTENTQDIYKHEKTVAPTERAPSRSIYVRRHLYGRHSNGGPGCTKQCVKNY